MKRNWHDIKWLFKPDGFLIDIYVQEVSICDWEKLIDLLNSKYSLRTEISGVETNPDQIDKEYAINYLIDESGEMEGKSVMIDLNKIGLNCHFFLPDQIEFDIDPKEINSIEDFQEIEKFMEVISKILDNQVTLTGENSPEFPLVKIDYNKRINKVLSEQEAQKYVDNPNSIKSQIGIIKTKLQMKFFPQKKKPSPFARNMNLIGPACRPRFFLALL